MMSSVQTEHWERVYRSVPGALPWEGASVPPEIRTWSSIVGSGAAALDLGCGRGAHALFMSGRGIAVTGIDISPTAIEHARRRAQSVAAAVTFVHGDVLNFRSAQSFDLVYDYSVLHHIAPSDLEMYVETVRRALKPKGYYALVCYSESHADVTDEGWRTGRFGNRIWHRSEREVTRLFSTFLDVVLVQRNRLGRPGFEHDANHYVFRRRVD